MRKLFLLNILFLLASMTTLWAQCPSNCMGDNTLLGNSAGSSITSGTKNAFFGFEAGRDNNAGYSNTFVGFESGKFNLGGDLNTFLGDRAGRECTLGDSNTFLGAQAGLINFSGRYNVFLGVLSGAQNQTGNYNTFLGTLTGHYNGAGHSNTFVGENAGRFNFDGDYNTFLGRWAGHQNLTGNRNTFLGSRSGYKTKGSGNVFMGYQAGYNEIGSDKLYIDNSSTSDPLIYGEFDDDFIRVNGSIEVNSAYNALYYDHDGRYGQAKNFDFNTGIRQGVLLEHGESDYNYTTYAESSGMYTDEDYMVLWSPGDYNRLVRFYDEDWMGTNSYEKAYIDGAGNYLKVSDRQWKEDITIIPSSLALEQILGIQGVSYQFIKAEDELKKEEGSSEERRKEIGFIAQDLERVFPEAVQSDEHGNRFVNYDAVIPLLVEALKAQQEQINRLNKEFEKATSGKTETQESVVPELYQNEPNPFDQITSIRTFLPATTHSASLFIYDMQGTQIKSMSLKERGEVSIALDAGSLKAGIYFYALIVDGKEVDMKRMILTD